MSVDVVVIGCGAAGLSAAVSAAEGGRTLAAWAETETVLAVDLGDGTDDPRDRAGPAAPRPGRYAGAGPGFGPGGDARRRGYFAGQLARAAHDARIAFAIGARRIAPLWRLLIRRVALDSAQVAADPRSRRRRTLHPDQRARPFDELAGAGAIYAYSFILTNLDGSSPDKAAAEHWHRHRTTRRDHGRVAAPGHLHHRRGGHPGRARRARRQGHDRYLAWRLIAVPGRLIRHLRHLTLRLPPGHGLLPEVLARLRDLPAPV